MANKAEKIPQAMQAKFDRIVAITDAFAEQHLTAEYADLIRKATAALCRKRPSPLASGADKSWACGITHAIGMVNFLFDPSQTPHMKSAELYKGFGVGASTGQAKSKQVRDSLDMMQMDPDWCIPSLLDRNPLAWIITVNGLPIDVRNAPREVQEIAYQKGLIPYLPETSIDEPKPSNVIRFPSPARTPEKGNGTSSDALFVLEVFIIDGPMTESFVKKNPVISRRIEIKGSNTLADLHHCIFQAFDREEEHMYEFQIGGEGPMDPNARRYGLVQAFSEPLFDDDKVAGNVETTTIAALGLELEEAFGYWFDFGDDWWHQINVISIQEQAPKGKYPKITARKGASPPQYADFD